MPLRAGEMSWRKKQTWRRSQIWIGKDLADKVAKDFNLANLSWNMRVMPPKSAAKVCVSSTTKCPEPRQQARQKWGGKVGETTFKVGFP